MSQLTLAISGLHVAGSLAPGLPVLRSLYSEPGFVARGFNVVGLAYDALEPPLYDEKLLSASYLLPYPSQGAQALLARLRYIHARTPLDVILPTLDSELPLYIQLAPELKDLGIRVFLPSEAAFARRKKTELQTVSELSGVRVPRSFNAQSAAEASRLARELPLPLVVKGALHGATVVYSYEAVPGAAAEHAGRWGYPIVLQEYIPGTEFDVVALGDDAWQLVGVVPMKKLLLDDRGKAWGALTVSDPALIRAARRVVSGLCWTGPLELELMKHRDTGELYLIELNPRFPAWVQLSVAAGQNLPWAHLQLALGEPVLPFAQYQAGVLQLRRAIDVPCQLSVYEALVQRGEVDLRRLSPDAVQPQTVSIHEVLNEPEPAEPQGEEAPTNQAAELTPIRWAVEQPTQIRGQRMAYVRPSISRHQGNLGSRLPGLGAAHRFTSQIDGVAIADLVAQHGSPLFVFSENTLRNRALAMRGAFGARYPKMRFGWSYKTNYLDAICQLYHQLGWDAEVVSDLEYAMARRLGVPGRQIICNGAYKPRAWLARALAEGALIQIDHFDELSMIEELAQDHAAPCEVALRVNLSIPALGSATWERFGFCLDNGEVLDAILRIVANPRLRLSGLHCHIGTYITDPQAYQQAATRMAELFLEAQSLCGYRLRTLNLGGGFPSTNALGFAYAETNQDGPSIDVFAEALCLPLQQAFAHLPEADWPTLILESGRHLIDDAGSLISTVVGTRRMQNGQRGVVLDAGLNVLYTAHWYRHRVIPTQVIPGPIVETSLFGPLCMNIDVLRVGLPLPPLAPGHQVLITPAGAYNQTQWMQFSQLRPACVLIDTSQRVHVIRRGESLTEVKAGESLPDITSGTGDPLLSRDSR